MASIERWKGSKWRARYRTPDGASRSQVFDRKIEAQRFLTSIESSKLGGAYVDPTAGRVSFRTYAEEWRKIQPHRASTESKYKRVLELHIYPALGDLRIAEVRPSHVQALITTCSQTMAPNTVRGIHRIVSAVFAAAVADRAVVSTPCTRRVVVPRAPRNEINPLSVDQVVALVDAAPERYRALVVIGAACGLRFSEAVGLTVDRVDFLRRTITVDRQLLPGAGGARFGPPKTDSSSRTIPSPQLVVDELAAHLAEHPAGDVGLIFTNIRQHPVKSNTFSDTWTALVAKAGLPVGTRYHELRHHYASLLIDQGASVKSVQRNLGHSSATVTLDVYGHLWPDSDERTRAAVDGVLGARVSRGCHDTAASPEKPAAACSAPSTRRIMRI